MNPGLHFHPWAPVLYVLSILAPQTSVKPVERARTIPAPPSDEVQAGAGTANIEIFRLSADEERLVYTVDADQDERFELYSIKSSGGPQVKLSQPFALNRSGVIGFQISPDSRRVVYQADHDARERFELYSVSIDGGPVVKIARPRPDRSVSTYSITPDSQHVAFLDTEPFSPSARDLYVAPLDGGPLEKLSRTQNSVDAFRFSPDGLRVAYRNLASSSFGISSTLLDGSTEPIPLASGSGGPWSPFSFEVSQDATRVVYGGGFNGPNLSSVPIEGTTPPVGIGGLLPAGSSISSWLFTPNGARVVYRASEGGAYSQLYSVLADRSAPRSRVSSPAPQRILEFQPSPSGRVAFVTKPDGAERYQLQSASVRGGASPIVLSAPTDDLLLSVPGSSASWGPLLFVTPDGSGALYAATDPAGQTSLFTTRLDGSSVPVPIASLAPGSIIRVNDPWAQFFAFLRETDLAQDPVRGRAVFVETSSSGPQELLSTPLDGSSPPIELAENSGSRGALFFATGQQTGRVYYTADSLEPGVLELFSVPIEGGEAPRLLVDL